MFARPAELYYQLIATGLRDMSELRALLARLGLGVAFTRPAVKPTERNRSLINRQHVLLAVINCVVRTCLSHAECWSMARLVLLIGCWQQVAFVDVCNMQRNLFLRIRFWFQISQAFPVDTNLLETTVILNLVRCDWIQKKLFLNIIWHFVLN